jgi:hypothetical protein
MNDPTSDLRSQSAELGGERITARVPDPSVRRAPLRRTWFLIGVTTLVALAAGGKLFWAFFLKTPPLVGTWKEINDTGAHRVLILRDDGTGEFRMDPERDTMVRVVPFKYHVEGDVMECVYPAVFFDERYRFEIEHRRLTLYSLGQNGKPTETVHKYRRIGP